MRPAVLFGALCIGALCLRPGAARAQSTDCHSTMDCAKVMVAQMAQVKVALADMTARLAQAQAQLAAAQAKLATQDAALAVVTKHLGNAFANGADRGRCTFNRVDGIDHGSLPAGVLPEIERVAWCPPGSYVAGLGNWKHQFQTAGLVCCQT